jgi:hypothetical protein
VRIISTALKDPDVDTEVRKVILNLAVLLFALPCWGFPHPSGNSPITVTANLASVSSTIPSTFVGISVETQDVITDTIYKSSNTSLINLIKLLGSSGNIRVGGTSQDTGHQSNPTPALTQGIANDLHGFVSSLGAGWKLIYGLDLGSNSMSEAVTHAGYVINAAGVNNVISLSRQDRFAKYSCD